MSKNKKRTADIYIEPFSYFLASTSLATSSTLFFPLTVPVLLPVPFTAFSYRGVAYLRDNLLSQKILPYLFILKHKSFSQNHIFLNSRTFFTRSTTCGQLFKFTGFYSRNPLISLIRDKIVLQLQLITPGSVSMTVCRKCSISSLDEATACTCSLSLPVTR